MDQTQLSLTQQVLLLCLDDETGTNHARHTFFALAGAALADLIERSRVTTDERHGVVVVDPTPTDDLVLNRVLTRLSDAGPQSVMGWIETLFLRDSGLTELVAEQLIARGLVTKREGRVLWVFSQTQYPSRDVRPEQAARERIRAAILNGAPLEHRDAVLMGLLRAIRSLDVVLSDQELFAAEDCVARLWSEMLDPQSDDATRRASAVVVRATAIAAHSGSLPHGW